MKALENIFSNLSSGLLDVESASFGGVDIYESNELMLYVENGAEADEMVGIEFQLFDENMMLTDDGNVFILGEDDEQYLIEDTNMLKAIASFLSWRTKILKDLSM